MVPPTLTPRRERSACEAAHKCPALDAGGRIAPMDGGEDALTDDQRAAMIWLLMSLLCEGDSRMTLDESGVDADSIHLDGTDLTCRDLHGRSFRIQVLPLDQP